MSTECKGIKETEKKRQSLKIMFSVINNNWTENVYGVFIMYN